MRINEKTAEDVTVFSIAGKLDTHTSPGLSGPNCIVFRPDGDFWVTGQISNAVHRFD